MKTTFNNFWTAGLGVELKASYMTGVNAHVTEVASIPALAGFGQLSTSRNIFEEEPQMRKCFYHIAYGQDVEHFLLTAL